MKKVFYLFLAVMMIPNVLLVLSEHQTFWTAATNLLLPLGFYWLAAASNRRLGVTIWGLFPFVFMAAFQIVLTRLFGQSIISVDMFLNVVTTNMGEITELLGNLVPAVLLVFVLYIPVLVMAAMAISRRKQLKPSFLRRQRRIAAIVASLGVVTALIAVNGRKPMRLIDDIFPVNVTYNLCLAVERYADVKNYPETSASFRFNALRLDDDSIKGRQVHVLVIGETARAENFGLLGYNRNTTPLLSRTDGVVAFTNAYSESNTTHKSVPMLLTAVSAIDFDSLYHQRGIITAFKETGFRTAFISNQRRNGSFIDFLGEEADHCKFIRDDFPLGENVLDDELLPRLQREINSDVDKPLLVVLHCYGSHFNYRERYTDSFSRFKPDDATEAKVANKESLVNAYDNTIVYTDHLLSSIIDMLAKSGARATMVYTSDHGEDLYDDGEHFLHSSMVPSDHQLHVPLVVWTSRQYAESRPEIVEALHANSRSEVSTSLSLFHSLMQMAAIGSRHVNFTHSFASRKYKSGRRMYIDDRNKANYLTP